MDGQPRAVADAERGEILVPPEQVFPALASAQVTRWWVRPGVFDTREWSGDVRPGGRWKASGLAHGRPYGLQGEFLEVTAPATLAHTYQRTDVPDTATTVRYTLAGSGSGTRITLRHTGFSSAEACQNNAAGWESSFAQLRRSFEHAASPA